MYRLFQGFLISKEIINFRPMQNRKAPLASGVPLKKEAGSNDSGDRLWEEHKLGLKRLRARDDLKLLGLKRLLDWDDQVWPRTQFLRFPFFKKIIDLPGGQINDPLTGKHFSLSFLPATA